jgi:hypothetical protein
VVAAARSHGFGGETGSDTTKAHRAVEGGSSWWLGARMWMGILHALPHAVYMQRRDNISMCAKKIIGPTRFSRVWKKHHFASHVHQIGGFSRIVLK